MLYAHIGSQPICDVVPSTITWSSTSMVVWWDSDYRVVPSESQSVHGHNTIGLDNVFGHYLILCG